MKYTKPALTFKEQAELLIQRGLEANQGDLEGFLSRVNYYRFSGYLYPFRSGHNEGFLPGTTFDQVRDIYYFDAELRLLTLSAIEIVDIAILRSQMVEKFSLAHGPFCYTNHQNFNHDLTATKHQEIIKKISQNIERSPEEFVDLFRDKYSSEQHFPFWMVVEAVTFGQLSILFRYLPNNILVPVAKQYNLHSRTLISWLHSISTIRNICAHHARLWNRILPVKPAIPSRKHHPGFYSPARISNDSYFVVLAILKYLVGIIEPDYSFLENFRALLKKYPDVPLAKMGLPEDWNTYGVFQ